MFFGEFQKAVLRAGGHLGEITATTPAFPSGRKLLPGLDGKFACPAWLADKTTLAT